MNMWRASAVAAGVVILTASICQAQEAIPRPAWIPDTYYNLVYPKYFGAEDVANMLIELPNRPLKAGEKTPGGFVPMMPYRRPASAPTAVAGPTQYLETPFGPVSSRLQSPMSAGSPQAKKAPTRRRPLGW